MLAQSSLDDAGCAALAVAPSHAIEEREGGEGLKSVCTEKLEPTCCGHAGDNFVT